MLAQKELVLYKEHLLGIPATTMSDGYSFLEYLISPLSEFFAIPGF